MKRKYDKYVNGAGRKIFVHGRRSIEFYVGPRFHSSSGGGTGLEDSEDSEDHKHGLACRIAKGYVATEGFLKNHEMHIAITLLGVLITYLAVSLGIYLSTVMTATHWIVAAWVTAGLAVFGVICWCVKWCEDNFHRIGKWAHKKAKDC